MRLSLIVCLMMTTIIGWSQNYTTKNNASAKALKFYEKAKLQSRQHLFEDALKNYDKALSANPDFIDALLGKGAVHLEMQQYEQGNSYLEKVAQLDELYEPSVWYMLGKSYWITDDFDKSATAYQQYLALDDGSEKRRKTAKKQLLNAQFAAKAVKNPVDYTPKNLGKNINTSESEYLPCFTADGETLIFTGRQYNQEDFFFSKPNGEEWHEARPLSAINSPQNEGAQSISADGQFLVFTACGRRDGMGSCDLYFTERRGDTWTAVQNIGEPINSSYWESQPSLSADGKVLFFSSDRPGGLGKRDLWVSYRQKDGSWGNPINMNTPINTPDDDESPFMHPDRNSFYFMSKGHPGMGGFDLYKTYVTPESKWATPENLGYPINTKKDEGALFVHINGKKAYFSSDAKYDNTEAFGRVDIYEFDLPVTAQATPVTYVKATVKDATTGKPIAATIECLDIKTNTIIAQSTTNQYGGFLICLPTGTDYAMNVSKKGYAFHSEHFELAEASTIASPFLLDIPLQPIIASAPIATNQPDVKKIVSKPIILKNVFFKTGSAELLPASINELNRLQQLLIETPNMRIQINGHTDNVGQPASNLTLSTARAKAVYDYLIQQGITANRLSYKGFGENTPIAANDTEEGRKQNRRTEFVIQ